MAAGKGAGSAVELAEVAVGGEEGFDLGAGGNAGGADAGEAEGGGGVGEAAGDRDVPGAGGDAGGGGAGSRGGHAVARNALDRAVALAKPGGVLMPFAELRGRLRRLRRLRRLSGPEALQLAAMVDSAMGTGASGGFFAPRLLTARDEQVLAALREGLTRKEIADRLSLSPAAAKRRVEKLYAKLGVAGREEAVASVTCQED